MEWFNFKSSLNMCETKSISSFIRIFDALNLVEMSIGIRDNQSSKHRKTISSELFHLFPSII